MTVEACPIHGDRACGCDASKPMAHDGACLEEKLAAAEAERDAAELLLDDTRRALYAVYVRLSDRPPAKRP